MRGGAGCIQYTVAVPHAVARRGIRSKIALKSLRLAVAGEGLESAGFE